MTFARGALADSDRLASAAQLLHELCFDEVELERPTLGYEPRCSAQCATCAALWIGSKNGDVMRIDLRVPPPTDPSRPTWPAQRIIEGSRAARVIHHVHDGTALGGGSHLLIGRDNGALDIFSDPPAGDEARPHHVARLQLHAWWDTNRGTWRDLRDPSDRDLKVTGGQHSYARGITAISTFRMAPQLDTLYILVATRHPRLYVIEVKKRRARLLKPRLMPGWIEWIVHPEHVDREARPAGGAPEPDLRIACISRGGHIVRLSHDELLMGGPGWRDQLPLLPTAAMPFGSGMLLLGTTTGLFLVRHVRSHDQATAVPVTRSPVLCLDRTTLDRAVASRKVDYVTIGLEDGRLRVLDARLLHELANVGAAQPAPASSELWSRPRYHNLSRELGSAVLVVETLQPDGMASDTAYVLAATRNHAVRLFHVTSEQTQRDRFATRWRAYIDARARATGARSTSAVLDVELKVAREQPPDGGDERAWRYAIIAVVLPRLADACKRTHGPESRSKLVELARWLAARADRSGLYQLSSHMYTLCEHEIEPLLRLSRAVLTAVPLGDDAEWKRFIAGHLRDLNALVDPMRMSETYLARLVAWTRFVRKYVLLGHTFASKQTELRELVERNCVTQKYLDALIYQARLCQQQHDIRWSIEVDERAPENVAALHTVACDGHGTVAVTVTADCKLAVFDCSTGRQLRIRSGDDDARRVDRGRPRREGALMPFSERGKARALAATVARTGDGFRAVVSGQLTPVADAAPGARPGSPSARKRQPALAVIDVAWSASSGEDDLVAEVSHVACSDEVHAVQPLPDRADAFVVGLESHAAPIGWLHGGAGSWSLEPIADPGPAESSDDGEPVIPIERSSFAPGKTPTRALAVAIDATTSGYLVVAGSDDGLVRVISRARVGADNPDWRIRRWERMNDAITMVVLGPHHLHDATAVRDEASDVGEILFSCYLGTASGDIFALSIEPSAGAVRGTAGSALEFGPHHAQLLWGEALDGPIAAAQIWRTPLYRSDQPHSERDESAEVLVVATEKGRLCLYNHAPSVAKGRLAFEVSTTCNYRFRGMRLSRVSLAGRVRALSMIEGSCEFVAAGPGGRLTLARLAYLRDSVERETLEQQERAGEQEAFVEPAGSLPTTMVARLDHLFLKSGHDAAFHDADSLRARDERKLDLCDLIRLERGAMSNYVMYRRLSLHEPWRDLGDDAPTAADLESRVRERLDGLDPDNPGHAVLFKVIVKSVCRKYLLRDPRSYGAEVVARSPRALRWHEETAVICDVVADYITRKLAYSTTAAARLRIVALKELLRVPVLRHIAAAKDHGERIRVAIDSALDSCLRDDDRLVRLEALRSLWVMLRNVSVMVGRSTDSERLIRALFPSGLGSVEWLLDRIVGGLLLVPTFRQRSALIGFAWYHISVLLPLFRIFSRHTLVLCNALIVRGLSLDVVALCVWALRGREAAAIQSRIDNYCLLTVLDRPRARDEYIEHYKRKDGPEPRRNGVGSGPGQRRLRYWYEIDDDELTEEMTQLLDLLAQMWDVRDDRQLAALAPVTVASDSPYAAIAEAAAELVEMAHDLGSQPSDRVRLLDRLAKLGDKHRSAAKDRPALTAPIRALLVEIVEAWKAICNPRAPGPGTLLGHDKQTGCDYELGEPIMEMRGAFRLAQPPPLRDSHVAICFYRWSTPSDAPRFRAAALATQALRSRASSEDREYIVDITKVLDERPPNVGYLTPIRQATLEASLHTLEDDAREQWTERLASHVGRALRAAHTRSGSGARYHGDVKISNILVELVTQHRVVRPVFRLGGFAPEPEPDGATPPPSIVPECLAQKYHGDELGQRQWDDVAALAMILYQVLTGRTLQLASARDFTKPVKHLDELLARPEREQRLVLPKIIEVLKDVFNGQTPALTIFEFLVRIEVKVSVGSERREALVRAQVRHQLRVLHLSDLHHRGPRESDRERRRRVLGEPWLHNIRELRRDGEFDIVAFTGDVAYSGAADEYGELVRRAPAGDDKADAWLDDTLAAAGCNRSQLYIVPGNHDIDRNMHRDAWQRVREVWSTAGNDDDVLFSSWFVRDGSAPRGIESSLRDRILERESAYHTWLRDFLKRNDLVPDPRRSRLGYRTSLALERLPFPVHIIGLDSAWLAGDEHDARKLRLTDDQILRLCNGEDGNHLTGLRIALIHHPLGELADGERARGLLREHGIDLMLSGHLHSAHVSEIAGPDGRLRDIATGCLYQHDRHPNAVTVLTLGLDGAGALREVEFRFRSWSDRGFWHDNSALYPGTSNGRLHWFA